MSFFGSLSNYTRPGPGVNKNTPPKKPFFRFFEVLSRKFTDLFKLNLLFAIPVAVVFTLVIGLNFMGITNIFLNFIPVIFLYPFISGLAFVTRNYVREEHAFIWGDYIEAIKDNLAKSLAHGFLSYVFFAVILMCINFYMASAQNGNHMAFLPIVVGFVLLIIGMCMQFYVPLMIVTFDLSLKDIYKNSIIFSFIAFPRNLCLILFCLIITVASFLMINTLSTAFIMLVIAVCILFSFTSYLINFVIYPIVEKQMIVPYYEKINKKAENNPEILNQQKFIYQDGILYKNYNYNGKDKIDDKNTSKKD